MCSVLFDLFVNCVIVFELSSLSKVEKCRVLSYECIEHGVRQIVASLRNCINETFESKVTTTALMYFLEREN